MFPKNFCFPRSLATLVALTLLGACSSSRISVPIVPGLTPHRIDIQQGNIVTQEMLDKLEPGMSRNQVRFILGTPLIVDPFRTDRWDYVYRMNKRGELVEQRQLKVFFKDDRMVRFEGDVVADPKPEVVAAAKPVVKPAAKPKPDPLADVANPVARPTVPAPAAPAAPVAAAPKPEAPALTELPRDTAKPQLRLAPSQGAPATPDEIAAAAAAAPQPRPPEPLEAVPLPRIEVPPESATPVPVKPAVVVTPPQPAPKPAVKPVVVAEEKPVSVPLHKPAEKPVAVVPAPKLADKPVERAAAKPAAMSKPTEAPAGGGFFGRLMDSLRNPPPSTGSFGNEREAQPGEPPPPFYTPAK